MANQPTETLRDGRLKALGDQMHALSAEIADLQESGLIAPFSDEEFDLADLQLQAEAYGDLLTDGTLIANLKGWLEYAEMRVAELRAESEAS